MTKEFNTIEEIEKYYGKKTNTYTFTEDEEYIDLKLDLNAEANIDAKNIVAIDANGNRWHIGGVKNDNWRMGRKRNWNSM